MELGNLPWVKIRADAGPIQCDETPYGMFGLGIYYVV